MEGLRVLLAASFFGLAALALYLFSFEETGITVVEANLSPMGNGFALTAKIANTGGPDRLLGVASDAAGTVKMTGGGSEGLPIPAESAPGLAMDGVHGMVLDVIGGTAEVRLLPMTFWFENAGKVTTRARIGAMTMDHGTTYAVPDGEPIPDIFVSAKPDGEGWLVAAVTDGFTFSKDAVDGPHQPGVGHGHLYLNGLKLQRIYGPEVRIGALPPGRHEVRVTLNTNDHRAYEIGGALVTAVADIVVD